MTEKREYYIYRHLKPCGEVFYIGLGKTKNRAKDKSSRSDFWKKTIKKYPDYEIQIISRNLTKEEAVELEIALISWYGRRNLGTGTLVNLTDGGDGAKGTVSKTRGDHPSAKKFINTNTLEIFNCKRDAAESVNLSYDMLAFMLRGVICNQTYIMHLDDYLQNGAQIPCKRKKGRDGVIDEITGFIYPSVSAASRATGIPRTTLSAYLLGVLPNVTTLKNYTYE